MLLFRLPKNQRALIVSNFLTLSFIRIHGFIVDYILKRIWDFKFLLQTCKVVTLILEVSYSEVSYSGASKRKPSQY